MTNEPWLNEPDSVDFEHVGYKCAMRRGAGGVWCGYVGITKTSQLFGLEDYMSLDLDIHGGITYSADELCGYETGDWWWFGFDCAHYKDFKPDFVQHGITGGIYRTMEYVVAECRSLAEQLLKYEQKLLTYKG